MANIAQKQNANHFTENVRQALLRGGRTTKHKGQKASSSLRSCHVSAALLAFALVFGITSTPARAQSILFDGTNLQIISIPNGANITVNGPATMNTIQTDLIPQTNSPVDFIAGNGVFTFNGGAGAITVQSNNATPEINANFANNTISLNNTTVTSTSADSVVLGDNGSLSLAAGSSISNSVGNAVTFNGSGSITLDGTSSISATGAGSAINKTGAGILTFSGTGTVTGTTTITGGTLTNNGTLDAVTNNATLNTSGTVSGVLNNGGALTLSGGTVQEITDNYGTGTLNVTANTSVTSFVKNSSTSTTAVVIAATKTLNIAAGAGTLTTWNGTVAINGTLGGNLTVKNSNNIVNVGVAGTVSGAVNNAGIMTSAGTLGGVVNNNGALTLSGGTVQQITDNFGTGTLNVTGNTSVTNFVKNSSTSATAVTIAATKTLTIAAGAGTLTTWNGTVAINGTLDGNLTVMNSNNIVSVGAVGTISGAVNNGGVMINAGNLTGAVTNSGTLSTTNSITGNVTNTGTMNASGTITSFLANNSAGTVTTTGNLSGITTLTQASSGLITVADGNALSAGTITVNAGSAGISVGAGSTLSGTGNTLNNNATITVAAGGTLTDAGAINNNAAGIISFANGGTLAADNDNAGGEGISNIGTLNINGGSVFVNAGTAGGTFVNTGGVAIATGTTLDVTGVAVGFSNTTGTLANNGTLVGALINAVGGTLSTTGTGNFTGALVNNGAMTMQNGATGDIVTVSGNFSGTGTLIVDVNTTLDTADTLTIAGNSSGSTLVSVNNLTPGFATGNDITLVTVGGTSSASDFALSGGAITAGAFNYDLSYLTGSFFLEKTLNSTGATYLVTPAVLGGFNNLQSMEQRIDGRAQRVGQAAWISLHGYNSKATMTSGNNADSSLWGFQVGTDLEFDPGNSGRWVLGVAGQYGNMNSTMTDPLLGTGKIATTGYGLGLSATWYSNEGTYVDTQGQVNWLSSDISSSSSGSLVKGHGSTAYALSVEAGHRFGLGANSAIVPQVQIGWGNINGGSFTDSVGNSVNLSSNNSTTARIGVAYEFARKDASKFYVIGNILRDFSNNSSVTVATVNMNTSLANPTSAEIGFGGTKSYGKMEIYGEASVRTALGSANVSNNTSFRGTFGLRIKF